MPNEKVLTTSITTGFEQFPLLGGLVMTQKGKKIVSLKMIQIGLPYNKYYLPFGGLE